MKGLMGVMNNGEHSNELNDNDDELDVEYAVEDDEGTRDNSCHSNHSVLGRTTLSNAEVFGRPPREIQI
jgi:hypothetical protein